MGPHSKHDPHDRPRGEKLSGGSADDALHGSDLGERIRGHLGDDLLIGSFGNDTLTGGAGDDIFAFGSHGVFDVIQDFSQAVGDRDRIWIDRDGIDGFDDLAVHYSGGDAILSYASTGQLREIIIVRGVDDGGLSAADFIFGPIG